MESKSVPVPKIIRWALALGIVAVLVVIPVVKYRMNYNETKRLRVVTPGKYYRSGRMTVAGLEQAIKEYKIKTVINLMEEDRDPALSRGFFAHGKVLEREICARHGVHFQFVGVDLKNRFEVNEVAPTTETEFLSIVSDPKNQPVLVHCQAGLHRTGVLTALYRMECEGWTPTQAWNELRKNGFGDYKCYADNDYIQQYIFAHHVRKQKQNQ